MSGGLKIQRYLHDHGLPAGLLSGPHAREPADEVHVLLPEDSPHPLEGVTESRVNGGR